MGKRLGALVFLAFFSLNGFASPLYLTFEGKVNQFLGSVSEATNYTNGLVGYINDSGVYIDSDVVFVLMIDQERQAYVTHKPGVEDLVTNFNDGVFGGTYWDFFYAELLSGAIIDGYVNEGNYGSSQHLNQTAGYFTDFNVGRFLNIRIEDKLINQLLVGDSFLFNYSFDDFDVDDSKVGVLRGNVVLVDISDVNPIPEPSIIVLLSAGMVGLCFACRRKLR